MTPFSLMYHSFNDPNPPKANRYLWKNGEEEGEGHIDTNTKKKKTTLKCILKHYLPNMYELCSLAAMRHILDSSLMGAKDCNLWNSVSRGNILKLFGTTVQPVGVAVQEVSHKLQQPLLSFFHML